MSGWRGVGPYQAILPGTAGGGGACYSMLPNGPSVGIWPGTAGGGGHEPSHGQAAPGTSGGGNTGPSVGVRRG